MGENKDTDNVAQVFVHASFLQKKRGANPSFLTDVSRTALLRNKNHVAGAQVLRGEHIAGRVAEVVGRLVAERSAAELCGVRRRACTGRRRGNTKRAGERVEVDQLVVKEAQSGLCAKCGDGRGGHCGARERTGESGALHIKEGETNTAKCSDEKTTHLLLFFGSVFR